MTIPKAQHGKNHKLCIFKFPRILQYIASLSAGLSFMMMGLVDGWSSPMLPKLDLTVDEASFVASIQYIAGVIAPIVAAIAGPLIGRKLTILLAAFPTLIGTLTLAFSTSVIHLYVGRFFFGLGCETAALLTILYIGEISSPNIRGRLTCFLMVEYNVGVLFVYFVGAQTTVQNCNLILTLFPAGMFCLFWFMPESPYFSVLKGNVDAARDALQKLNISDDLDTDFENIKSFLEREQNNKGRFLDIFTKSSNLKALFICGLTLTISVATGIHILLAYANTIFREADTDISATESSMIFAATGIFTVTIGSFLIDLWGRRPLFLLSTLATSVPLLVLGTYFYLQHINYKHMTSIFFIPLLCFIAVKFAMSLGITSLSNVFRGELFPSNISVYAAAILEIYVAILRFVTLNRYQSMADAWGTYTVFWILGSLCIIGAVLVYLFIPETKCKSLEELQQNLKANSLCMVKFGN